MMKKIANENSYTYDLNKAFPYWNLSDEERSRLWADPTHPSSAGYDVMGTLLAKRLYELVSGKELVEEAEVVQVPMKAELKTKKVRNAARQLEGRILRSGRVV